MWTLSSKGGKALLAGATKRNNFFLRLPLVEAVLPNTKIGCSVNNSLKGKTFLFVDIWSFYSELFPELFYWISSQKKKD